jgi:pimeloyl-ACP methyl ester carboxylesterase
MLILDKYNRVLQSLVVRMGGRVVDHVIDGYHVHSYELTGTGAGPDLVLVHGLGGSANSFFSILPQLRSTWRKIYIVNLPGHGFSRMYDGQALLDIRGHQRIFARYLDEVVKRPVVLVGNSMGGAIVIQTAIDRPRMTLGLALLAPAGAPLSEVDIKFLRDGFRMDSRAKALDFVKRLTHKQMLVTQLIASDIGEEIASPVVQHVLASHTDDDHFEDADLRALRMPILLVWGASEKILPAHGLKYFRRVLPPHARIEVFEECGHVPMMEQPALTVALLNDLACAVATQEAPVRDTRQATA